MTGTSLYSLTLVSSYLYKPVPTVLRLKSCTVKCISNSLIQNLQGKHARFIVFSIQYYDGGDYIAVS